jgi:hypothetical protein
MLARLPLRLGGQARGGRLAELQGEARGYPSMSVRMHSVYDTYTSGIVVSRMNRMQGACHYLRVVRAVNRLHLAQRT